MSSEFVVLVDAQDKMLGTEEKMKAHQLGLLHRAFSVFVYRRNEDTLEFLLQQRHPNKYHCGGLWTNTCCSHPRVSETVEAAAMRRLKEEMNLSLKLSLTGSFLYRAEFDNGLIEHELDYVLIGEYQKDMMVASDPAEVQTYAWKSLDNIQKELDTQPERYTPWFAKALNIALEAL